MKIINIIVNCHLLTALWFSLADQRFLLDFHKHCLLLKMLFKLRNLLLVCYSEQFEGFFSFNLKLFSSQSVKVRLNSKNVFRLINSMYIQWLNTDIFPVLNVVLVSYRDLSLQNAKRVDKAKNIFWV